MNPGSPRPPLRSIDAVLLGGALLPLGMWGLYATAGGWASGVLLLFFQVGLNLPHYFQTYTLTYFDPATRRRESSRLWTALAVSIAIPCGAILCGTAALRSVLAVITVWGLYHITQQTRGLVTVYLRRGALGATAARVRRALLVSLFAGSAATLMARIASHGLILSGEPLPAASPACWLLAAVAAGAFVWALRDLRASALAAFSLVALNVGVFALAMSVADLNVALVIATSWHAAQYLALSLLVQRKAIRDNWFARLAKQEVVGFFGVAVVFGVAAAGLGAALPKPWGQAVYLPLLLLHYINDAWLWRPDRNPEVRVWLAPLASATPETVS